jgi:hypothetical protein
MRGDIGIDRAWRIIFVVWVLSIRTGGVSALIWIRI